MIEFALVWICWTVLGIWWLWLEATIWIQRPPNPLVTVVIIITWPLWLLWRLIGEIKNKINRPKW